MMKIAIGAGLVWLLIFAACAVLTRIPPRGRAGAGRGLATAPPALINLVVAGGRLDGAAYAATILDLACRGELVITESAPDRAGAAVRRPGRRPAICHPAQPAAPRGLVIDVGGSGGWCRSAARASRC